MSVLANIEGGAAVIISQLVLYFVLDVGELSSQSFRNDPKEKDSCW